MKLVASLVLAAATATLALSAHAQFAKPEDAIKYRKSALSVMGTHFGRVAAIAETMSKLPFAAFGDGTDKGDTKARPEIWSERAKFNAAAEKMQGEMTKLAMVAKGGNIDAIKAQVGATGGACKACHDDFRKE
jgi:cytochrome c556